MPFPQPWPDNFAGYSISDGRPIYLNEIGMLRRAHEVPRRAIDVGHAVINGGPCTVPDGHCTGGATWQLIELDGYPYVRAGCGHWADLTKVPTAEQVLEYRRRWYGTDDGNPR